MPVHLHLIHTYRKAKPLNCTLLSCCLQKLSVDTQRLPDHKGKKRNLRSQISISQAKNIFFFFWLQRKQIKGQWLECSANKQEQALPKIYVRQIAAGNKHQAILLPNSMGSSKPNQLWQGSVGSGDQGKVTQFGLTARVIEVFRWHRPWPLSWQVTVNY